MIGKRLHHYRIAELLGTGGMGAVYRAHDEQLDRDVALKMVPPEVRHDEQARARLLHEARALSRLNHPGIGAVYDFVTGDEHEFVVMELVPGVTLEERVREGPLDLAEAVALAVQVADALAAAHRENVVHRDVKPANLKLTPEGRLKVLDFGVAVLGGPAREHAETAIMPGGEEIAGTLAYMAPEQLRGEVLDGRTDVYGLGITLFELLTGRRPFGSDLAAPLIDAILNAAPPDVTELRADLPPDLAAVVSRCIAKRPEARFQSAEALREALRGIMSPSRFVMSSIAARTENPVRSVAVLPLENLSRDPDEEYFADGMTEALIAGLARIRGIRVISRTSVMRYKEDRPPLPSIARALHVDAIVEGSVLRAGDRVRITARLIEAHAERPLWSDTYDRDLGDILVLQSDVSSAIAREIRHRLTAGDEPSEPAATSRAADRDAVQAYLKGRFHWEKRSEEAMVRAIECFNEAIERDPLYAAAHVGLADCYIVLASFSLRSSRQAALRGKAAAQRALEIDPSLAEAWTSLAAIADSHEWDREEASRLFRRAIELNPNYANAHHWYSDHLCSLHRFDEALDEVWRAVELDPLSTIITTSAGTVYYYARRYEESVDHLLDVLDLDRHFPVAWRAIGGSYEMLGRYDEALDAFERARELTGDSTYAIMALAHGHAIAGQPDRARELLAPLGRDRGRRYVSSYSLAAVHTALGDFDEAFRLLDRALADRDRALVWLPVSPRLDPLKSDPRFDRYVKAVGA